MEERLAVGISQDEMHSFFKMTDTNFSSLDLTKEDAIDRKESLKKPFFLLHKNTFSLSHADIYSSFKESIEERICQLVTIFMDNKLIIKNENMQSKINRISTQERVILGLEGLVVHKEENVFTQEIIEKIPVVDEFGKVKGLIAVKDVEKSIKYPDRSLNKKKKYFVGVTIETGEDMMEKIDSLVKAKIDAVVIDEDESAFETLDAVKKIKNKYSNLQIWSLRI